MTSTYVGAVVGLGVWTVVALTPATSAQASQTLHDQRQAVLGGTWNGTADAYIGGFGAFGNFRDSQSADDFTLSSLSTITAVPVDLMSLAGSGSNHPPINAPAGGFLVELFADVGGTPAETPTLAVTTMSFANMGGFPPALGLPAASGATFAIDLSANSFVLGAGTWWLSVVAVDETPFGQFYRMAGVRNPAQLIGSMAHARQGGADHGNGYSLGDWTINTGATSRPRELSFRVDGEIIPAPSSAFALLGAFVGFAARRRRSA